MEEIKETLNKFTTVCTANAAFSAITFLLVVGVFIIENNILTSLHDLEKDVNAVNYNVRGIDDGIRMNRSTEANIEKLLNDYKKLKVENEVLLERIQSYKEKYEKK